MLHQIDTADAEDGHKSMWLKSSADKVIEANLLFIQQCFVYSYDHSENLQKIYIY